MNQQLQQAKQESENKIVAMREKAQATFIAKYGEHTANFIGGIIDLSFRNGVVIAMLDGAPPLLRSSTCCRTCPPRFPSRVGRLPASPTSTS